MERAPSPAAFDFTPLPLAAFDFDHRLRGRGRPRHTIQKPRKLFIRLHIDPAKAAPMAQFQGWGRATNVQTIAP